MGKKEILEYLEKHPSRYYTAREIYDGIEEDNPGLITRNNITANLRKLRRYGELNWQRMEAGRANETYHYRHAVEDI